MSLLLPNNPRKHSHVRGVTRFVLKSVKYWFNLEILQLNWDFVEEVEENRFEHKSALTEVPCLDS